MQYNIDNTYINNDANMEVWREWVTRGNVQQCVIESDDLNE